MKNGICPKCDKNEVYLSNEEGRHGIAVPLSMFSVTLTELYVCANCGYLEFYVQHKEDLAQIPNKFRKVKA
jgi:predicted nucleic-acid-binding Zn-ribbon protein